MNWIFQSTSSLFLLLVIVQAFHSIEEYIGRLWENFPPATYVTGLVSEDHETGFIIINIGMFLVGMLAWVFAVRPNRPAASIFISIWILIEIMNGIIHPVWGIMQGGYEPGVITAPFLLIVAILLLRKRMQVTTH